MDYSFRIRLNRCPTTAIQTDKAEVAFDVHEKNVSVLLRSSQENSLKDSESLVLVGGSYSNEELANASGVRYRDALMVALAGSQVGVDFGFRAAKGVFTSHGLEWAGTRVGARVLNDVHGLMVYETEPRPRFVSMTATPTVGKDADAVVSNVQTAIQARPILSDRELVSFTLFNASFFQPTSDTRFILLVMSIEALIDRNERREDAVELVDALIENANRSNVEQKEKDSIVGSLRQLRKESINQAGQRLAVDRLGADARYQELRPREFFAKCYKIRSNLAHGNTPLPDFNEVGSVASALQLFVADILTSPYLSK